MGLCSYYRAQYSSSVDVWLWKRIFQHSYCFAVLVTILGHFCFDVYASFVRFCWGKLFSLYEIVEGYIFIAVVLCASAISRRPLCRNFIKIYSPFLLTIVIIILFYIFFLYIIIIFILCLMLNYFTIYVLSEVYSCIYLNTIGTGYGESLRMQNCKIDTVNTWKQHKISAKNRSITFADMSAVYLLLL